MRIRSLLYLSLLVLCIAAPVADAKRSYHQRIKNMGQRVTALEETNAALVEAVLELLNENDRLNRDLDNLYGCLGIGYILFDTTWMVTTNSDECFYRTQP